MIRVIKLSFLLGSIFFAACASSPQAQLVAQNVNGDWEVSYQPYRLIVIDDKEKKVSTLEMIPAGTPALKSLADEQLKRDIMDLFRKNCQLDINQLKEIRFVRRKNNIVNEVWIFDDSRSERADKITAMSVVLKFVPLTQGGGTDINFFGIAPLNWVQEWCLPVRKRHKNSFDSH